MKLYLVTSNENKLREISLLLPDGIELESIEAVASHRDIIEDSPTFLGNSVKKIEAYM
ncbi:MAG: non-canonical purine NTP pyrophosphatase, partial [Mesotoga sp.]